MASQSLKLWLGNVPFDSDGRVLEPDDLCDLIVQHMDLPRPMECLVRRGTGEREDVSYAIVSSDISAHMHKVLACSKMWPSGYPFIARFIISIRVLWIIFCWSVFTWANFAFDN